MINKLQVATWRIPQSDATQLELLNRISSKERALEDLQKLLGTTPSANDDVL